MNRSPIRDSFISTAVRIRSTALMEKFTAIVLVLLALLLAPTVGRAGFLNIDDTNPDETITISANDFENGLSINGVLLQQGLGQPASITLPETSDPITFSGSWIDNGQTPTGHHTVYLVHSDGSISDILDYNTSSSGGFGTISGTFQSDIEGSSLGTVPDPLPADAQVLLEEANRTVNFSQPFLTALVSSDCENSYNLHVEVGYDFFVCDSFGNCADPDTGFITVSNNGTEPFVGEIRLDGTAGGGVDVHETTGSGFTLAPGASVTLIAGTEGSNQGGFNKTCGPDNGLLLTIVGTSGGLPVSFQKYDKDIHSGTARDVHAPPSALPGDPLLSDSYILQGGDPFGGDTGDDFEVTQAHASFDVTGACGTACTLSCSSDITVCNDPGQCGAVVNYADPSLSGDCTGLTISCDHASGSSFPVGMTTVTCTATDASGNPVSSCTFNVTVNNTETKCPLSQGYWKTHRSAWPVTSLTLGTITYTEAQLLAILSTPQGTGNKADASLILADQLIAAKLNLANGSNPCPIADTIAAADALIDGRTIPITPRITPNSPEGKQMVSLGSTLASYNGGGLTPGCTP